VLAATGTVEVDAHDLHRASVEDGDGERCVAEVASADNSKIDVDLTYSGLSGAVTGAHIHAGASAANGPLGLTSKEFCKEREYSAQLDSPCASLAGASSQLRRDARRLARFS